MKVSDLTDVQREKVDALSITILFLKSMKGPRAWKSEFGYSRLEFLPIENHWVLLPLDVQDHLNISILRCLESRDGEVSTLFLKDTTWIENEKDEFFQAGFLAICDRIEDEEFFVATVYHEWSLIPRGRKPEVSDQ